MYEVGVRTLNVAAKDDDVVIVGVGSVITHRQGVEGEESRHSLVC